MHTIKNSNPVKVLALLACMLLGYNVTTYAQEITEVNQKTDNNLIANYHILKDKPDVKWGAYLLYSRKNKMAIASGSYKNNERTGVWRFYDSKGKPLQMYDFTTKKLTYEAPESDTSPFKYLFDVDFTETDTLTKPVRIGGRYYGYLPYSNIFVAPEWFRNADDESVTIELLISPGGRLAEYNIHLTGKLYDGMYSSSTAQDVLHVNLNALAEEDKLFVPALKNGEPVSSRIVIRAQVVKGGKLLLHN